MEKAQKIKKNIVELNVVKAIAILAVLIIHATANSRVDVPWGSQSAPFYLIVNQLSMFAVPVFIFINGLVLFYRYQDDWSLGQTLSFYKKRIKYIVVPYLIWSAIYYVYNQILYKDSVQFDPISYLKLLQWGQASYHLYFMVIVIQIYLFFPILMTLVRKLKLKAYHMIALGILVKAAFHSYHVLVKPIEHAAALMPNYFIVFCVGAAIGMAYQSFSEKSHHLWWTFGLAIFVGFIYIMLLLSNKAGAQYWSPSYMILYNLYAVLVGISLIWIGKIVCERSTFVSKTILQLGIASFGIYLIHPAVLSSWRKLFNPTIEHPYYHIYNVITLLFILVMSWFVVHVTKKIKFSWLLWGR
ncbi:acyltransferase [Paenibacillus sp. GSMTC-2017]|uniref:acyltransferase n=1 Tax=Paenibacillus sp. GSMTC-2017 TaxID=2794350 RepID=UPI0018D7F819|nr:acyltransferase [Paenibacillus sp. GSMTC-2017]MBH5319168.1 acyltransferase [Paenibacillus sp. GSMTC-2017]